ncbi:DNA binding protein [Rhynchospora pubera]|uniref:DNA binding protein n=1 Tax=Rhynchospora pubera TaxID=906938 RepID=A0AAV8GM54_9POAL|nr:DNA binding protein [Rhynchospora pubera]
MEKPSSLTEAQDDLEIVSIGSLYRGHWEKKYWSSSRAKDRYPYPVGYRAIRTHSGTTCQMEIREGPKGPLFLVKMTDGESCSGMTPDLAWKSLQKKTSPKAINWNGRRLSSNIDGSELFGFKNKVVQRLLRELVANANSTPPNDSKQASKAHEIVQNHDKHPRLVYLRKSKRNSERNMKFKPEERSSKRLYKEGCTSKNKESSDLLGGSQKDNRNEEEMEIIHGDNDTIKEKYVVSLENYHQKVAENMPFNAEIMQGSIKIMNHIPERDIVHDSYADTADYNTLKSTQPLPEKISPLVDCTPQDAIMKEGLTDSMPDARLSSGSSNLSSQKTDQDSEQQEITRSMMAFLLPQAIPLLKKTYCRKSSRKKMQGNKQLIGNDLAIGDNVGGQFEAGNLNHISDSDAVEPTSLNVIGNKNLPVNDCKPEPLIIAEVKNVIPDCHGDNNPTSETDHKTAAASSTDIMKEDDNLNNKSDNVIVGSTSLHEIVGTSAPLIECEHEPLNTLEAVKNVIPDSFDQNYSSKGTVHKTCDSSGPTSSVKKEEDNSQDLDKTGILLSDSLLACFEEEFVKIENERVQNSTKMGVCLSESITSRGFDNTALAEHQIASLPLESKLEVLFGPYLHPQPVLSVTLSLKGDCLELCVLCGTSNSCERSLYVYSVNSQAKPSFVGYTSMLFLSSEEPPFKGNLPLGRVGLQCITEGSLLVHVPSIKTPFCSNMSISCSCLICKPEQVEENYLKIVRINFGFVSRVTELMSHDRAACILVCKPNYVIAFEVTVRLHVWVMSSKWSTVSDEFTLPGSDIGPSILELREVPRSNLLVLGHDGCGVFCLWDITKRALLSKFRAPSNIILEILPLSCFNTHKNEVHGSNYLQAHLKDIGTKELNWTQSGEGDAAVWLLVSSATVSEFQKDLKAKEPNRRWRLALLAKNSVFMGPVLDQRISVVDATTNYGFAGTLDGLFYKWELSSGRKVASMYCFESGSVSCIAVDHMSGAMAVADDRNQVLIYML